MCFLFTKRTTVVCLELQFTGHLSLIPKTRHVYVQYVKIVASFIVDELIDYLTNCLNYNVNLFFFLNT